MHVTSQTTVAAPIETVWDALSDHLGQRPWLRHGRLCGSACTAASP
jgi:uncharacterized protein YndB with AHSA1/START domain